MEGMKYLAYLGVALVAFWAGWVVAETNRPPPIVRIVKAEYVKTDCKALVRQCVKERRSM